MAEIRLEKNAEVFANLIKALTGKHHFRDYMIEKDYYLTKLLAAIENIANARLIFKGGTCLNKIYLGYYRMSEDLDFINLLPQKTLSRKDKSKAIDFIRTNIAKLCDDSGLTCENKRGVGADLSSEYTFNFEYTSIITRNRANILFQVTQKFNPILKPVNMPVKHMFNDPFTGKPLFPGKNIYCLEFREQVAEKIMDAITRPKIASRDVFDLQYFHDHGFNFLEQRFLSVLRTKLKETNLAQELEKYPNFGRGKEEMEDLKRRLQEELYPVLRPEEADKFNLDRTLEIFNSLFRNMK